MTSEHRRLIDLADLRVLRLECPDCGGALTLPNASPNQIPAQCPSCGLPWLDMRGRDFDTVRTLLLSLNSLLAEENAPRPKPRLRIRFELTTPTPDDEPK